MDRHTLCSLETRPAGRAQDLPLSGAVRLTDGLNQVGITFDPPCLEQPFQNNAKLLSNYLGLPIVTDHQVFDSIDHFLQSLRFTIPGGFFDWDEPIHSYLEEYGIEMGHINKFNFQPEGEWVLLDVVVEFQEFRDIESNYQGAKAIRHGIEMTISGGEPDQLEMVRASFQQALDDYARLLNPAII